MSTQRVSLTGFILIAGLVLGVAVAEAAESAQALLNKGNKAFAAGDYVAALEAFQKGHELSPSPFFLRSIGYSYLKMYKHDKAREALQDYLKKYPKQPDAKKIQDIVGGLDVVVQTKVSITTTPPGADLYFDTEAAGKVASTPFDGTIEPGKHTVILKMAGYHLTVRPFNIPPKQALKLDIPLEATLKVDSEPTGADVRIDSESSPSLGKTPLTTGIAPGRHKLIVSMSGYKSKVESFEVKPPTPVTFSAKLDLGIRVVSRPPGAKVEINGRALEGVTPLEESVPPGLYKVSLSMTGYKATTVEKRVAIGSDNLVEAKLEGGLLTMRTDVEGAKVLVDGKELGTAPAEKVTVPLGRHEIQVSHPDRRGWSSAVDFEEGQMIDAQLKLARPTWPIWAAGGLAVVGAVLWVTGYVVSQSRIDDLNDRVRTEKDSLGNLKNPNGFACSDVDTSNGFAGVTHDDCKGGAIAHMGTAGAVITGTALGTGLLYWLIWGRTRADIRKLPAEPAQPPAQAKRPAATAVH